MTTIMEDTVTSASTNGHDVDVNVAGLNEKLDEMRKSMAAARDVIRTIRDKQKSTSDLDFTDGISLLSIKHHLMLQYLQSLVLVVSRQLLGHTLTERSPPQAPFSTPNRGVRGSGAGDRVDSMIETRLVLEKTKILEERMKYQIEKLVRLAEEDPSAIRDAANDPLAFKPNPQELMDQASGSEDEEDGTRERNDADGIYRPPKLAPVPYTESRSKDKSRRAPVPTALSSLVHMDPSRPYIESTSGLGSTPTLMTSRARELQRMTEFEEENMTRLVMKKREDKRRRQDEADMALGGMPGGASSFGRRGRGGGLEDEFGDILKSVGRSRNAVTGDGYEELRQKGRREGALARSRARGADDAFEDEDGPRARKRGRFDKAVKASKKRAASKRS